MIYVASHGGFHPEQYPLGGGAAVSRQLIEAWGADPGISLTLLAPGLRPHDLPENVRYVRLQVLEDNVHPAQLDRRAYARFCRRFEDSATSFLDSFRKRPLTNSFAVLCNDICEGVDFKRVAAMGFPVTTIFHVDVADFFSRMYLGSNGPPVKLVKFFRWVSKAHLSGICPDVLRLVFEKQADCLRHSSRIVVPSDGMVQTIAQCYGNEMVEKTAVVPWGGWEEPVSESEVEQEVKKAVREFDLNGETTVLLTMSRISPEKGLDHLLKALRLWEKKASEGDQTQSPKPKDIRVLICGSAAFMGGESYAAKIRRMASSLQRIRVAFPGHVGGARKRAFFRVADLFVVPSRHESYGLTLVEALRQGVPVVSSATCGARHLVNEKYGRTISLEGKTGTERLLRAIQDVTGKSEVLRSMKNEALIAGRAMDFTTGADTLKEVIAGTIGEDRNKPGKQR